MIGIWIQQYFDLVIPGSVIGLMILFLMLITGILKPRFIKHGANVMIDHLVLFFIPTVVGIVNYLDVFSGSGVWLIVITVVSTLIVMVISGKTAEMLVKRKINEAKNK